MPGFAAGAETALTVSTVDASSSVTVGTTELTTSSVLSQNAKISNVNIGTKAYTPASRSKFTIPGTSSVSSQYTLPSDAPIAISSSDLNNAKVIARTAIISPETYAYQPNAQAGIKVNEAPTPAISGGNTKKAGPTVQDIPTFLSKCLTEAQKGAWRETGQAGAPSNQNIVGIWPYIGLSGSPVTGPWATDQTAWCMGFVQFTLKSCGYNYYSTASALDISNPLCGTTLITNNYAEVSSKGKPGDIILFSRGSGFGHVCFLYKFESDVTGYVGWSYVGGNQKPSGSTSDNDGDVTKSRCTIHYAQQNFMGLYRPSF